MAGISISVDAKDLSQVLLRLKPIFQFEPTELMTAIGALGESQTRRRIESEKTSPDGTPWLPNREGESILYRTGQNLLGSVAFNASSSEAEWGASWEYAHVHQEGAIIKPTDAKALAFVSGGKQVFAKKVVIPARPFVGLSSDNEQELLDLVTDHFGALQ